MNLTNEGKINLSKVRLYRFSDNLNDHIVIEEIENKYTSNRKISDKTINYLDNYLDKIAANGLADFDWKYMADLEGIDIAQEMKNRMNFSDSRPAKVADIEKAIFIIGSPRSGTSYLYNLLAYQGVFAYFTNVSHHIWSRYNLENLKGKHHFQDMGSEFFQQDSKTIKLNSSIILPSESENIFSRVINSYKQLRTHQYELLEPEVINANLLINAIANHTLSFKKNIFLCKSPFNSFRIQRLKDIFKDKAYFIHIHRNGYNTSESIKENGFKYFTSNDLTDDTAVFWARHIEEILKHRNAKNFLTVSYENLINDVEITIKDIFNWLDVPVHTLIHGTKYNIDHREYHLDDSRKDPLIEKYNKLLGYK